MIMSTQKTNMRAYGQVLILLGILACGLTRPAQGNEEQHRSPYGVCAHLIRGEEYDAVREELERMEKAGIKWARADFSWSYVQPSEGQWQFKRLDRVVELAEEYNVRLLPILDYSVSWADPAHEHLDAWSTYVRRVVRRYGDRIRYWEVWNEPNIDKFWPDPDAGAYARLLKATFHTIKNVDPDLKVVLSGMAGIPTSYLRALYEAGAADHFDVMNVHPYRYPRPPEVQPSLGTELEQLRCLMAEYGDRNKPIWITELGWPTHRPRIDARDGLYLQVFRHGLRRLLSDRPQGILGIVRAPGLTSPADLLGSAVEHMVPDGLEVRNLSLERIGSVDPDRVPVLLLPEGEGFPASARSDLVRYVKHGGVFLLASQGVPFFRSLARDRKGGWSGDRDTTLENQLHIGWEAHWTRDRVPEKASTLTVGTAANNKIALQKHLPPGTRFLTDQKLKGNDQMVPLIRAGKGTYEGTVAGVYDYDSDLTGGAVIITLDGRGALRGVTERRQAELLTRSMLLSLQNGVDRFFWYEFRAMERDPWDNESHFGLLHGDLSQKPGYRAYGTLTRVRPEGSRSISSSNTSMGLHRATWKRPDGRKGWAFWQRSTRRTIKVRIEGSVDRIMNVMGRKISVQRSGKTLELQVGPEPVYLIGNGTLDTVN